MSTAELHSTAKRAGTIGITALLGAGVGFILQLLVAYYFGAGYSTDAFFMAQSTSEMLGKLLMGGSVTAVFIPLFIERLSHGKKQQAWDVGLNIVNSMSLIYILLLVCIFLGAEDFIHFIAPGFEGDTLNLTVSLLQVLLPSFFFLFLVEFATSMLHSFQKFALPSTLRIIAPLISTISIALFARSIGIYSLAIGVAVGSVIQFAILFWGLLQQGMRYRFFINIKDPALKKLLHLVYPFVFSVLATQGAAIVYRILVSDLAEGSLSAIKFAEKITQLITIMFLNSVTLVIYPLLSQKVSIQDTAGMKHTIALSLRLIVFITLPLILAIAVLREQIISIIYERGSFSAEDARLTSIALLYLVLGLTTTGISSVLGHVVLALQKTRAAVAITICSQVVAIALFAFLTPTMGVGGLALASSLVPLSSAVLYFFTARKHIPGLATIFMHWMYGKTIILSALSTIVIIIITSLTTGLWQVIISVPIGAAVYLILSRIWHIEEATVLSRVFFSKFGTKHAV